VGGAGFEWAAFITMFFSTFYRSLVARLVATFMIALVVSPYTHPFATAGATDFGGSNAIDVVSVNAEVAPVPSIVAAVVLAVSIAADRPLLFLLTLDAGRSQHAILRL
jgi:hypothetical protein